MTGEILELLLASLRADFELVETWQYRDAPPLPVPIVAYGGADDPFIAREALEGWRQHTSAEFCAHQMPGNHFYWSSDERALLRHLSEQAREP